MNKVDYHIDPVIKKRLAIEKARHDPKKEWDTIFLVCGDEGVGKTTFVQQVANYIDKVSIDNLAFNNKQFINMLDNWVDKNAIFDESVWINSMETMKRESKDIFIKLTHCRSQRLYIWFCIPSYYDLPKKVIRRARGLFYLWVDKNDRRGNYCFYPKKYLEGMWNRFHKALKPIYPKYSDVPHKRFSSSWVLDKKEYQKAKREGLRMGDDKDKLIIDDKRYNIPIDNRKRCAGCGSISLRTLLNGVIRCKSCGYMHGVRDVSADGVSVNCLTPSVVCGDVVKPGGTDDVV
jgi:hypothetical protein